MHTLVDETTSEKDLQMAVENLQNPEISHGFSEEQQRRLEIGLQQIKEGKYMTLEEFLGRSESRLQALKDLID